MVFRDQPEEFTRYGEDLINLQKSFKNKIRKNIFQTGNCQFFFHFFFSPEKTTKTLYTRQGGVMSEYNHSNPILTRTLIIIYFIIACSNSIPPPLNKTLHSKF